MHEQYARWLRWGAASVTVALALAGCGGGDSATSASGSASAAPSGGARDQAAAIALAMQSVNARTALPRPVALAAVSAGTATEDFESGMADWTNWGNSQVVAGAGTSGSSALQVGTAAGGAALRVPGVVAGTSYRLTAQVRVTNPSEPVAMGINFYDTSGGQLIGFNGPQATGTSYGTYTFDGVAPAGSAYAMVWVWKNAGTGYADVDDVAFGPAGTPPPPPSAPPEVNLLSNGGFESGMSNWIDWGHANVVSGQANSGASALAVGTAAGGAGHDVGGIVAGTTYRLVAHARVSDPSETVFVGVNFLNAAGTGFENMALPVTSTSYSTVTFDIRALTGAARAVVFVWKNDGSGFGYVDDVVFGVAPGSAPPPPTSPPPLPPPGNLVVNGGFENGLANWVDWGNATVTGQAAVGTSAAQVGTGAGGFGQDVGGIVAGASYRLSASVKVSSPDEIGYLGVRFTDEAGTRLLEQAVAFGSGTYSTAQLDLTAPANASRALVYVWKNAGSGFAYVDEVALGPPPAASPAPEPVSSTPASAPRVAQLANGGRIVAWVAGANGSGDVLAQVFDATGTKVGAPVTAFSAGAQGTVWTLSGVGTLPDGSFLVAASGATTASGTPQTVLDVQKVSATGQLLASGGTSDPGVNGGLADLLVAEAASGTTRFVDASFFANADGSWVVAATRVTADSPNPAYQPVLVNVAATGSVVGTVELGTGYAGSPAPVLTRLGNGNFLVAGTSTITYGPVVWKVVTSTGQVVAQQSLGAAPGNGTFDARVTTLADGTGLLTWGFVNSVTTGWAAERIDGNGIVVASVAAPPRAGAVTGLAAGGWVQTWIGGTQLMAQYFATSGQAAGDPFVVAGNLAVTTNVPAYSVAATADGFVAACSISTANGPEVDEIRFTAPASLI